MNNRPSLFRTSHIYHNPHPSLSIPALRSRSRPLCAELPRPLVRRRNVSDIRRPTIRVRHRAGKAHRSIEQIRGALIPGTRSLDLRLAIETRGLGGIVGAAHVDELVAECVGDDVGVQGVLLAAARKRVRDLEGEFVGLAAGLSGFEDDGGSALAEVSARDGGCPAHGCGVVVGCGIVISSRVVISSSIVVGICVPSVGRCIARGSVSSIAGCGFCELDISPRVCGSKRTIIGIVSIVVGGGIIIRIGILVVVRIRIIRATGRCTTSSRTAGRLLSDHKITQTSLVE